MPENPNNKISDKVLVEKVRVERNLQAWEILRSRYYSKIFRYCEGILKNIKGFKDVENIVLETFVKAFINLNQYESHFAFSTWVFRISRNLCLNTLKTDFSLIYLDESVDGEDEGYLKHEIVEDRNYLGDPKDTQEVIIEKKEKYDILRDCLGEIDLKFREVILLYYFSDFNDREIAEVLSIPERTVTDRRHNAQEQLRRCLNLKIKFGKK